MPMRLAVVIVVIGIIGVSALYLLPSPPSAQSGTDVASGSASIPATPDQIESPDQASESKPRLAQTATTRSHASDPLAPLLERAKAGEIAAACELGIELNACAQLERLRHDIKMVRAYGEDAGLQEKSLAQLTQRCGNHTQTAALDAAHWHLQAALGGSAYSKGTYRGDTSYLARAAIERPELVRLHATHAPEFWREGIAQGQKNALMPMARALAASDHPQESLGPRWLRWSLQADPVLARSYAQTYAREQQLAEHSVPLPNDPKQRANELRMREARSLMGGRKAELDQYDIGLSPEQIATSNAQVEQLMRARAAARAAKEARLGHATETNFAPDALCAARTE